MNWKKRLGGKTLSNTEQKTKSRVELLARRDYLLKDSGQKQFTKAVIEAELLQVNQELLNINNLLSKMPTEEQVAAQAVDQEYTPEPKVPEVLPPELGA